MDVSSVSFWRASTVILAVLLSGSLLWPTSSQSGKTITATGTRNVVVFPNDEGTRGGGGGGGSTAPRPPPPKVAAFLDLGLLDATTSSAGTSTQQANVVAGTRDGGGAVPSTQPAEAAQPIKIATARAQSVVAVTQPATVAVTRPMPVATTQSAVGADGIVPGCAAEVHTGDVSCEQGVCGPYRTQQSKAAALMVPDTAACCAACVADQECMT
jgi:hypothetical protein